MAIRSTRLAKAKRHIQTYPALLIVLLWDQAAILRI